MRWWVDDREEPVVPPPEPEPWGTGTGSAYVYGYRSDTVELDVDVFPRYTLDAADVARSWEVDGDVQVMSDEPGGGAAFMESNGLQHAAVEIDGAVVRITSHGLGEAGSTVSFGFLHSFAKGFRVVDEDTWQAAIETADLAPPFGERGAGDVLVSGDGWELVRVPYRQPRWTTEDALVLRADETSATEVHFTDEPAIQEHVWLELSDAGDRTIVWGVAAPEAAVVQLWNLDGTIEVSTVPFGNNTAFAVDVRSSAGPLRELTVWHATGERIYAEANPGNVVECVDEGDRTVIGPKVEGMDLPAAITTVEDAGMTVRGTGTASDDPIEDATVTVQEPPTGTAVPPGACIGFRVG